MAYLTIPESKVTAFIGSQIGSVQQALVDKVQSKIQDTVTTFVKSNTCPPQQTLNSISNTKKTLTDLTERYKKVVDTYKAIPNKLRPPINTLDSILKVLLALPIPTSVPPGIGVPLALTNKYADLVHKIRELIAQTKETVDGIDALVDTKFFDSLIEDVNTKLSLLDGPIQMCSIENELKESLTDQELTALGLLSENGTFLISRLVPSLVKEDLVDDTPYADAVDDGNKYGGDCYRGLYDPNTIYIHTDERRDVVTAEDGNKYVVNNRAKNGLNTWLNPVTEQDWTLYEINTKKLLEDLLNKLSNTSLIDRKLLDNIINNLKAFKNDRSNSGDGPYVAANGTTYYLSVIDDTTSPKIAQRRFAVARDESGIIVMKGQPSFASDSGVLIREIKYRLNQLK